ncbi:MAG: maleylacetoacetate isomerase [Pseudomonadota bacterium]
MKLFAYFRSSTSYRLRIALELKGLDYEVIPVDLRTSEQSGEAFTTRNPFGSVPMLEADGRDRAQSMALIEWLEEAYPARPLLPADIEDRYTARELAYAIATEIHALNNLQVLKYLRGSLGHGDEAVDAWYHHWLARTLDPVEARCAQIGTGDFLFDAPSFQGPGLFEVVLLPQLFNARKLEFDLAPYPHLTRIEAACLALPEFQRAYPDNQPDSPDYKG